MNESVNIGNTQDKIIGAVVTDSSKLENGVVFNYTENDEKGLFLKGAQITGYFEADGTLLNVGKNDLTLAGDTNITTVKNDFDLNVSAVKIEDGGSITIMDEAKINGRIEGTGSSTINFEDAKGVYDITGGNVTVGISDGAVSDYQNYFDITLTNSTPDKDDETIGDTTTGEIKISTENAVKDLTNKLVIDENVKVKANTDGNSIYDTNDGSDEDHNNTNAELNLVIENIGNIEGNIKLGVGKDNVTVKNTVIDDTQNKVIDLGAGANDKFTVLYNSSLDYVQSTGKEIDEANIFNFHVENAETIEFSGGVWGKWNEAQGTVEFDDPDTKANLVVGDKTTMLITLNAEGNYGSDFANYIDSTLGEHTVITGTDKDSVVKFIISEKGFDTENMDTTKYSFGDGVTYTSPVFTINNKEGQGVDVSLKSASDIGAYGAERIIYDAYIEELKNGNDKVISEVNSYNTSSELLNTIQGIDIAGEAYYTAGTVVTKDITNTYLSAVEDFTKRAGKGEWLKVNI